MDETPYAGLILPDVQDLDQTLYIAAAKAALALHDPMENGRVEVKESLGLVSGATCGVVIEAEEDSDFGPRILIEIVARNGEMPPEALASRVLSDTVLAALETSAADIIEWYSPDTLIGREDFIHLRSLVAPELENLTEVELEEVNTVRELRQITTGRIEIEDPNIVTAEQLKPLRQGKFAKKLNPQRRRLGLAGWLMAIMLALISAPVAVALILIGVVRGMDFRLATQALSITALFVVLENSHGVTNLLSKLF